MEPEVTPLANAEVSKLVLDGLKPVKMIVDESHQILLETNEIFERKLKPNHYEEHGDGGMQVASASNDANPQATHDNIVGNDTKNYNQTRNWIAEAGKRNKNKSIAASRMTLISDDHLKLVQQFLLDSSSHVINYGASGSGKTYLINTILGKNILPLGVPTKRICLISFANIKKYQHPQVEVWSFEQFERIYSVNDPIEQFQFQPEQIVKISWKEDDDNFIASQIAPFICLPEQEPSMNSTQICTWSQKIIWIKLPFQILEDANITLIDLPGISPNTEPSTQDIVSRFLKISRPAGVFFSYSNATFDASEIYASDFLLSNLTNSDFGQKLSLMFINTFAVVPNHIVEHEYENAKSRYTNLLSKRKTHIPWAQLGEDFHSSRTWTCADAAQFQMLMNKFTFSEAIAKRRDKFFEKFWNFACDLSRLRFYFILNILSQASTNFYNIMDTFKSIKLEDVARLDDEGRRLISSTFGSIGQEISKTFSQFPEILSKIVSDQSVYNQLEAEVLENPELDMHEYEGKPRWNHTNAAFNLFLKLVSPSLLHYYIRPSVDSIQLDVSNCVHKHLQSLIEKCQLNTLLKTGIGNVLLPDEMVSGKSFVVAGKYGSIVNSIGSVWTCGGFWSRLFLLITSPALAAAGFIVTASSFVSNVTGVIDDDWKKMALKFIVSQLPTEISDLKLFEGAEGALNQLTEGIYDEFQKNRQLLTETTSKFVEGYTELIPLKIKFGRFEALSWDFENSISGKRSDAVTIPSSLRDMGEEERLYSLSASSGDDKPHQLLIGNGSTCSIHRGMWKGLEVAIKFPQQYASHPLESQAAFANEIHIQKLFHSKLALPRSGYSWHMFAQSVNVALSIFVAPKASSDSLSSKLIYNLYSGDLDDFFNANSSSVSPKLATIIMGKCCMSIFALQMIGINHRNIRPEKFLYNLVPGKPDDIILVINSFGYCTTSTVAATIVGSQNSIADEVSGATVTDPYDPSLSDIFSLGLIFERVLDLNEKTAQLRKTKQYKEVLGKCISGVASERPSIQQLQLAISQISISL